MSNLNNQSNLLMLKRPIEYEKIQLEDLALHKIIVNIDAHTDINNIYKHFDIFQPKTIEKASLKRKSEFLIGRISAKYALKALGFNDSFVIHKGMQGEPIWPENISGSISHAMYSSTKGMAISYACNDTQVMEQTTEQLTKFIAGIDIELKQNNDLFLRNPTMVNSYLSMQEFKYSSLFKKSNPLIYLILFSSKESIIKAIFSKYNLILDFHSIHCIKIDNHNNSIEFYISKIKKNKIIKVNFIDLKDEIITYCKLNTIN